VVGRVRRKSFHDGPLEPCPRAAIAAVASGGEDDRALLLLGAIARRALAVVARVGVELPREPAGLCVTALEPEAARAGHAGGAAAGRRALYHRREEVHAGD